jgi:hypothetical protein
VKHFQTIVDVTFVSIYFSQVHKMTIDIKLRQQHCNVQVPKNLAILRDSNSKSSVLPEDAMTTMPCRRGVDAIFHFTALAGTYCRFFATKLMTFGTVLFYFWICPDAYLSL